MNIYDPALHRELSAPRPNETTANVDLKSFSGELADLFKKHRIQDALFIASVNYTEQGVELPLVTTWHFGDPARALAFATALYRATIDMQRAQLDLAEELVPEESQ